MKNFIAALVLLLVSVGCNNARRTLPYYDSADFTPRWELPANGKMHSIRPFVLTDQANETVTERDLTGKIAVVSFFFASCPDVCPITIRSMLDLQQRFEEAPDVVLFSHSVTPRRDSVPVLRAFAEETGVNAARWKLLTGPENEIYDLGRNFYFVEDNQGSAPNDSLFTHTENLVLLDRQRRLRGIYNGMDPNGMRSLVRDITLLRAER